MATVLDQLPASNFSLDGPSNLSGRVFGYFDTPNNTPDKLHNQYSIFTTPNVKLKDFNGNVNVRPESQLDETDTNAPNNTNPNVTIYKSLTGRHYSDLGPVGGHY